MTLRKYLVLAGVAFFAATGDGFIARGMKQVGNVSLHHLPDILLVVLNPVIALGVLFLLVFFACYMTALVLGRSHLCAARDLSELCCAHSDRQVCSA